MNSKGKNIFPQIKWAQRKDKLFFTIEVANLETPKIELTNEGSLSFEYAIVNKI